jgi:hypothetical protein
LVENYDATWLGKRQDPKTASELVPISAALYAKRTGDKVENTRLQSIGLSQKAKFSPAVFAEQYFRELIFLKALELV